jgi:hypothetical protein
MRRKERLAKRGHGRREENLDTCWKVFLGENGSANEVVGALRCIILIYGNMGAMHNSVRLAECTVRGRNGNESEMKNDMTQELIFLPPYSHLSVVLNIWE